MRTQRLQRLYGRRIGLVGAGGGGAAFASDPEVSAITADGWRITYDAPPSEFDPVGDPKYVAVKRGSGYSAAGVSASLSENIEIMKRTRLTDPNENTLTIAQASIRNFIYDNDTVYDDAGAEDGVTNNSTRLYPKPIAMWLNHDRDVADAASYTVRMVVFHAHGRLGKPVAGVRFTATDAGVGSVSVDVNAPVTHTFTGSGLSACVYEGSLDFSSLADGDLCTIDAVIYPWVGNAFTVSTDADTYPSPNLCVLKVFNNYQGTAAPIYAYVDGVGAGTPTASTTEATALANPFADDAAALAAIETLDGTDVDRGVVKFMAGTHLLQNTNARTVTDRPPIYTRDPAAAKSAVNLQNRQTVQNHMLDMLKVYDVTVQRGDSAFAYQWANGGASASDMDHMIIFEDVDFDLNGFSAQTPTLAQVGRLFQVNCTGDNIGQHNIFLSSSACAILMWGCSGSCAAPAIQTYGAVGCTNWNTGSIVGITDDNTVTTPAKTGMVWAFNKLNRSDNDGGLADFGGYTVGDRGLAWVGNVVEGYGGAFTQMLLRVSADTDNSPVQNLVMQMNTVVGQRCNLLYNESGDIDKSCYEVGTLTRTTNTKGDVHASQPYDGNWAVRFQVGKAGVVSLRGDEGGRSVYSPLSWLGEVAPLYGGTGSTGTPIDPGFAADRSNDGSPNTGNGDYAPTPANLASYQIPGALIPISVDLEGNAIAVDGTAIPGGIQQ